MSATSPTPPGRDRRLILLVAVIAALALAVGYWWRPPTTGTTSPPTRATPTLGAAQIPPVRTLPAANTHESQAGWARAVAAVGEYDDGRRTSLDDLAPEVRALIDPARALLAGTPRQSAPGLPMVLPDGTVAGIAPDPQPRVPADPTTQPTAPDGSPTLAERERARAVDGRLVARTLSSGGGKTPPPSRGDRVMEILEPDAWMAVPYDPALVAGEPLELTNRSLGQYVLRVDATDYGSVRLNGGLVVPGRFYLMQGSMSISGTVPLGVVIRPLGVVHGYYEQPVRLPSANG